jgi:hypothetical protein
MSDVEAVLKEILDRLARLEQPHQHLAQSITAGILKGLNESGVLLSRSVADNSKQDTGDKPVSIEPAMLKALQSQIEQQDGICAVLGALPPGAIVTEEGLATLLKKHPMTIKRAIKRGQLPPPVKFFQGFAWTAGTIIRHLEKRLEQEAIKDERFRRKMATHFP